MNKEMIVEKLKTQKVIAEMLKSILLYADNDADAINTIKVLIEYLLDKTEEDEELEHKYNIMIDAYNNKNKE